jgi:hypothetical protein
VIYSRQPTWHWSRATKGAGGSIIGGRPWSWWRRQVCCLFPFAAKCICAGVFVTVAMCVPGTGVQRDGCHQWLIIARRPQTSGWERVDDGARPGQLSVPWVMGQEILVRETGSPRTSSSNIRGLAGFRDSSDNRLQRARNGEQRKREARTCAMTNLVPLELRGFVAAKAASSPQPR